MRVYLRVSTVPRSAQIEWLESKSPWPLAFAVLIGGGLALKTFSGVSVLEVVAVAVLPVLLQWFRQNRQLSIFIYLLVLWMVGIVVSNAFHGLALVVTQNELQVPLYIGLSSLLLSWVSKGFQERLLGMVLGAAVSSVIYMVMYPSEVFIFDPWKFGLALPVSVAALALAGIIAPNHRWLSIAILSLVGVSSWSTNFRSMTGVALVAMLLAYWYSRPGRSRSRLSLIKLFVALVCLVAVVFAAYALVASSGALPDEAAAKYQNQIKGGNVLVAARPELVGSYYAILQSPLIGLGSGGALDSMSQTKAIQGLANVGAVVSSPELVRLFGGGVNSHSLLLSAWVQVGVLGMLPWAYLIYLGLQNIVQRRKRRGTLFMMTFWAVAVTWDTLFSPYSSHMHVMIGAFVAVMTWPNPERDELKALSSEEISSTGSNGGPIKPAVAL